VIEVRRAQDAPCPPAAPSLRPYTPRRDAVPRGRAGLLYRDLLPSRLGGRWVASHIRAPRAGRSNDRVHHHAVRLQLIYCLSGEAQLVYEDQGPPFPFRAGDLVMQPPGLPHQVIEASAGFEVVEIASPAWHPTSIDHAIALPSTEGAPGRLRSGQRFLHAVGDRCPRELLSTGVEARDLGLQAASGGLATARALRFQGRRGGGAPGRR
jgi:uncharacterized RmlC-like cupin family protein